LSVIWIVLAGGSFAVKSPEKEGWISLEFLGVSRSNRDLSMGYTDFSGKKFSWAFDPGGEVVETGTAI
jgi:hypothetical protein